MGIAIPQVITPSKASGAQVIDGSLKFDDDKKNYLKRTPSSVGNRKTWTWSAWVKKGEVIASGAGRQRIFSARNSTTSNQTYIQFRDDNKLYVEGPAIEWLVNTPAVFRDNAWGHVVVAFDTTQATATNRVRVYWNGVEQTLSGTQPSQDYANGWINNTFVHSIGNEGGAVAEFFNGSITNTYFIDGQQLDASYFGFTDPLTNTWKPKKFDISETPSGSWGTNGFYLPLDGNSPIGQDQSGQGNDWTPTNFGGSVALDNPQVSGARPILNTTQGGTQAGVGVFGSKQNVGYAVTVYNDGGGNKYYIDGVKQDTVTGLIRGATYTFDTSDSTVSSHPFRFSATSNGSHGGGSEYTNGVAAITGAATTITVPHDAPNTLYYYCTSHSGMGADITGITTNEKLADQYASHCVLALPLVGNSGDVSTSIACTSSTKAMTDVADAAASSDTSNFYGGSFEFDGTGDGVSSPNSTDYAFGTGDFTVECWWNVNVTNTNQIFIENWDSPSTGWQLYFRNSGDKISWYVNNSILIEDTNAYTTGKWHHAAVCRSNGTTKLYIDGDEKASASDSTNYSTTEPLTLGRQQSTDTNHLNGYLQDVRIYKGVAKYTSDFVVPSRSPDILPDTPSGVSGSSKLTKITDGAVSFDGPTNGGSVGTGYLTIPSSDSSDFNFGTGDFTWEAYVYCVDWTGGSSNDDQFVIAHAPSDNNNISGLFVDGGQSYYYSNKASSRNIITGPVLGDKRWYHIAASRESGTLRLFVDGVSVGSASYTDSYADAIFTLGRNEDNNKNQFRGFISNFRVIKGTALYTKNFTPPSAPLTNVTNTKLLCCQSNSSAVNYAVSPGTITANGDAAATTFNPFNTDINTVRGQETGYATLNPLVYRAIDSGQSGSAPTFSDGNLTVSGGQTNDRIAATKSLRIGDSGKYFWEIFWEGTPASSNGAGIRDYSAGTATQVLKLWYYDATTGDGGPAITFTQGDALGFALNASSGNIDCFKNGVKVGSMDASSLTEVTPFISMNSGVKVNANFGQKPFKFSPPDGFQPLNAANTRPVKVISRPDQYVGVTTYKGTGDAVSPRTVELPIAADLVWAKSRDRSSSHQLVDTVRGNNKVLISNSTDLERDPTSYFGGGGVASIDGKIISIESGSTNNANLNTNGEDAVVWHWKAGGNKNTFNVDDVGYASASDVNMNVGGLNNTLYNQSQTWSNDLVSDNGNYFGTQTPAKAFDGDLTTKCTSSTGTGGTLTLDLSNNNLTGTLEVVTNTGMSVAVTHSGGTTTIAAATSPDQAETINFGSLTSISQIVVTGVSAPSNAMLYGIKLNGAELIDSGVSVTNVPSIAVTGCSVGTKQGFSIIKWTADDPQDNTATIAHGLTQKPDFWLVKSTTRTADWIAYTHKIDGSLDFGHINNTEAFASSSASAPTATTFGVYGDDINYAGATQIAYLWHDVPGLQKFGIFTANANENGPYVELGFRPVLVVTKKSSGTGTWFVVDAERDKNNVAKKFVEWQDADAEASTQNRFDFLSNGFKVRAPSGYTPNETSGDTYIYMAWAEAPSIDLYGGGANAR